MPSPSPASNLTAVAQYRGSFNTSNNVAGGILCPQP